MAAGRPPKYETVEDIEEGIDEYFDLCKENEDMHPTVTGLALHLGFDSRQSFYDYKNRAKFSYTIKRARLRIENYYETQLMGQYSSGPIFALKNLGWSDKQEIEHSGGIEQTIDYSKLSDKTLDEIIEASDQPDES